MPWAAALAANPGVEPKEVNVSLAPGGHTDVKKVVHTPPIVPKPDIYFLADTTGSMGPAIANVQSNAASIISGVTSGGANDPRFGAGDYKDFPVPSSSPYAYKNGASIPAAADGGAAATTAINNWSATGGSDGSEANLFALHKLISAAGFRSGATKIVVWFGDAPGHDPVCSAISGEPDVDETSVTNELKAAGIKVIAVSIDTGFYSAGLNDDPTSNAGDYAGTCPIGGTSGQANRIAAATGGVVFTGLGPDQVSAAILKGLTNLPVKVTPKATCDTGLSATFAPTEQTVTSGTDAVFTETISLAPSAPTGDLHCTVDFLLNGEPAGDAFVQKVNRVNRPPDCSKLAVDKTSLWPPNHKFVTVTVSGATDPDADPLTTKVTGVTQDEPLNGLGDGDTSPDAATVAGHPNQVQLRAERSGTGDGRVYKVAVTVSDGHLTCSRTLTVGVPHDQSGPPAVDSSPPSYNSFGP
ncbi:MAG TPA: vWA domain-containing protein [Actinomycetes bacterium]